MECILKWSQQSLARLQMIPKIIHRTWKTQDIPDKWTRPFQSCIEYHPDWRFMLWTDASIRSFLKQEYEWFLPTFDGYAYPIQRVDAARYFILRHFGGVYMDLDVGCLRRLEPLLNATALVPKTEPIGYFES